MLIGTFTPARLASQREAGYAPFVQDDKSILDSN